MAKRKLDENLDDDEELANMFGDADSSPPTKRAMTPAEAWDAIEQQKANLTKSGTPISELDKVPTMEEITKGPEPNGPEPNGPEQNGGKRKMRKTGKARKMKTKKSSKSRTRKSTRRRHKNRRTR